MTDFISALIGGIIGGALWCLFYYAWWEKRK